VYENILSILILLSLYDYNITFSMFYLVSYWNSIWFVSLYSFIHHVRRHIVYISHQVVGLLFVSFIVLSTSCMKTHRLHFSSSYYCLFPLLAYIPFYIMCEDTLSIFLNKLLLYCLFRFKSLSTSCMKTHCPHLLSSYYCCFFFYNYISEVVMCTYYQNIFCLINCLIWKLIINTTLPHISHFTHFV
jgi:hypothetical protein